MNEGYSAPCGSVLGVQDTDPRSSKELQKWLGRFSTITWDELMAYAKRPRRATMDDERWFLNVTRAKLLLAQTHVDFVLSQISIQGPLQEASAMLVEVISEIATRLADLEQK